MSTRTIIEINHDHLSRLDADTLETLVDTLKSSRIPEALNSGHPVFLTQAVRVLAQRHHSDAVELRIGGYLLYSEPASAKR